MSSPPIESLHEQKVSAAFRAQRLAAVPSDLLTLRNVVHVDLSQNELTRFPGALVAAELPRIEVLLLQDNLLFVLEDVFALSQAPRLRELDISCNPLRLLNNRVYLLEALLNTPGCDEEFLLMDFHDVALKHAGEGMNPALMKYRSKLPRKRGFPMLMKMNNEWITDREVREVEEESGMRIEYYRPAKHQEEDEETQATGSRKTDQRSRLMRMMTMTLGPSDKNAKLEHRHFDGSRMTMRQIIANNARGSAIPAPQMPQRFQIDITTGNSINAENNDDSKELDSQDEEDTDAEAFAISNQANNVDDSRALHRNEPNELGLLRQLFRSSNQCTFVAEKEGTKPYQNASETQSHGKTDVDKLEPWNYPASTFDALASEDRHYVRSKSKQTGEMLERDDHFFASTPFVDCVVQCERSRRLTMRAVDLLAASSSSGGEGKSVHQGVPSCDRAVGLTQALNASFSREQEQKSFEKVKDFETKRVVVSGSSEIRAAVTDYFLAEHMERHQATSRLLNASNDFPNASFTLTSDSTRRSGRNLDAATDAQTVEMSLSKVKLQNAVDLASSLLDPKQQRRMIQMLIDADAKVIEEERVALDQMTHRRRLARIRKGKPPNGHDAYAEISNRSMSPWQVRNWRAKKAKSVLKQQEQPSSGTSPAVKPCVRPLSASASAPAFRGITTVDLAAQDPLNDVSSHELLLRCASIRQHAGRHMRGLAAYRHHFREEEAEWEHMRHEPANVVRRHLHRRLYRDAPQVQIGGTQYFFSPLFE